jgi:hypothetical protein
VYNTRLPRKPPADRSATRAPTAAFAQRKNAGTRHHAPVEERTSLARDNHAPATSDPDSRKQQRRNKKAPVNPSGRRVSQERRWIAVDLVSKFEDN